MKILFVPASTIPFHGRTLEERPLGGTESGVIHLALALHQMGHQVFVLTEEKRPPVSIPLYVPFHSVELVGPIDALIGVRDWRTLTVPVRTLVRAFWTGDAWDQPISVGIGDRRVTRLIDLFFVVSEWHRDSMCEASGFPIEKGVVIRNGIEPHYFTGTEKRERKRLMYSSTPYRGLEHLERLFPKIRERHPDATLHIFSGAAVYENSKPDPETSRRFERYVEPFRSLPGCVVHGNVRQRELAREFMRSSVLAYPNTFAETSCITALEAQVAGCVPVTTRLAALPETVGNAGVLIGGSPGEPTYDSAFVDSVCRLLSDDEAWGELSRMGQIKIHEYAWARVAERVTASLSYTVAERRAIDEKKLPPRKSAS